VLGGLGADRVAVRLQARLPALRPHPQVVHDRQLHNRGQFYPVRIAKVVRERRAALKLVSTGVMWTVVGEFGPEPVGKCSK